MSGAVVGDYEVEVVGGFFLWMGGCHNGKSEGSKNRLKDLSLSTRC